LFCRGYLNIGAVARVRVEYLSQISTLGLKEKPSVSHKMSIFRLKRAYSRQKQGKGVLWGSKNVQPSYYKRKVFL
ncbi:MAG: hypothetical protein KBD27_02165, partial [Candidatus Moranbacteria bacterium]|nr:hypothetical protein [Candidatus Moranbacteria bacterium]